MFDTQLMRLLNPLKLKRSHCLCVCGVVEQIWNSLWLMSPGMVGGWFRGNTWGFSRDLDSYFTNTINIFPQESPASPVFPLNLQTSCCRPLHHYPLETFSLTGFCAARSKASKPVADHDFGDSDITEIWFWRIRSSDQLYCWSKCPWTLCHFFFRNCNRQVASWLETMLWYVHLMTVSPYLYRILYNLDSLLVVYKSHWSLIIGKMMM